MSNRRGFEFPKSVKKEANADCQRRHPESTGSEVHHILPIYKAREYGIPEEVVKNIKNAVALERAFHKKVHQEMDEETYIQMAEDLLNYWAYINGLT